MFYHAEVLKFQKAHHTLFTDCLMHIIIMARFKTKLRKGSGQAVLLKKTIQNTNKTPGTKNQTAQIKDRNTQDNE